MTDGRRHQPAHRASCTPLTHPSSTSPLHRRPTASRRHRLVVPTVAGLALGLTGALAAPAGAADLDSRIDQAQGQVDRLDSLAGARSAEHDKARDRVVATEERLDQLTARIRAERRTADELRADLAQEVMDEHGASSAGTDFVPVADVDLPETSERLLAGVALVTEDAGDTATRLAEAEANRTELLATRAEVRDVLQERRTTSRSLGAKARSADAELGAAQGRLDGLEEERAAKQAAAVASSAVAYAKAQVGKAYVWGAAGPSSFDCSGLTMAAWATQGVSLPHSSSAQYASGTPVSESELQPGDLVFYYSPISHVGIYVGDGQIVNALNPGSGVQISGLHDMPYSGAVRPG